MHTRGFPRALFFSDHMKSVAEQLYFNFNFVTLF
jgi:hypothetical protein